MSDPRLDLDLCLTTGELIADQRDHCRVDLRSCVTRLQARTSTVQASLAVPPPAPSPERGLDLGAGLIGVSIGLALGVIAGAALTIAARSNL